ncbi:TFIIIC subunit 6 family protein [Aspergillus lucknowensis]|uniref:Transcription factor TFIIIC triple barrel domain-containing protein n=1 Tax=Aspergillus lucknowensis TaxID=176173 RepID=A0ABR4LPB4_9EURO
MSVLDPALASSSPPGDDDDSEWEYEYHDTETETFFLNLDLTTQNGPLRPPRRRNEPSASVSTTAAPTTPSRANDQDSALNSSQTDPTSPERVQILGLHGPNPIISYQNQIFSGSWADQIGTELFFSHPTANSEPNSHGAAPLQAPPLKQTKDFDLIAANSVKILGRKANLISSSGSGAIPQSQLQQQRPLLPQNLPASGSTPTSGLPGLVYKPEHQSNQARFLERLKDVKRRKGETDNVRTVFSSLRRAPNLEDRLRGWVRTEEQLATIQQLNERALQGDPEAITELETICSQLGNQDAGSSETPPRSG